MSDNGATIVPVGAKSGNAIDDQGVSGMISGVKMAAGGANAVRSGEIRNPGSRWRIAVLLSGAGRTLENLLQVIARGELPAEIVMVVSSVPDVRGLTVASAAGIPTATVVRKGFPTVTAYSEALYAAVAPFSPDLIVMAGFLRQMFVLPGWEGRILNIHPALLPDASHYAAGKGLFGGAGSCRRARAW